MGFDVDDPYTEMSLVRSLEMTTGTEPVQKWGFRCDSCGFDSTAAGTKRMVTNKLASLTAAWYMHLANSHKVYPKPDKCPEVAKVMYSARVDAYSRAVSNYQNAQCILDRNHDGRHKFEFEME